MSEQEPVAFGIEEGGRFLASYTCEDEESASEQVARFAACVPTPVVARVVPLYRQPQPALTVLEMEAVSMAIASLSGMNDDSAQWRKREIVAIATLRGLLERCALREGGEVK